MDQDKSEDIHKFNVTNSTTDQNTQELYATANNNTVVCEETNECELDIDNSQSQDSFMISEVTESCDKKDIDMINQEVLSTKVEIYDLESLQKFISKHLQELQNQNYIFRDKCIVEIIASYFNRINFSLFSGSANNLLSYNNIVNQYDQSTKLVDEYGRVFFYIPGVSDALLSDSEELKEKYSYLIQMYREWLSTLNSYEVKIENGQDNFINVLGNRSFIYGDKELIDKEKHKFKKDYKTSPDNFHVVIGKNSIVYFSEIPEGSCKLLESERIIENLSNFSTANTNFHKALFSNNIESTVTNHEQFFKEYNSLNSTYIPEYQYQFLYSMNAGLPELIHRFKSDNDEDIRFNVDQYLMKPTLLFLNQKRFNQIASEMNFLSQEHVKKQLNTCNQQKHQKFHYSYVKLIDNSCINSDDIQSNFWSRYLSNSLYLQTNAAQNLLFSLDERKQSYIDKIIEEKENLLRILEFYIDFIINFNNFEEKEVYQYFIKHEPKNYQEKKSEKQIFDSIENLLRNSRLCDLKHLETYFSVLILNTESLVSIGQEYSLSNILSNNPEISLLELMSYSILVYINKILEYEFSDSLQNMADIFQKEKYFIAQAVKKDFDTIEKDLLVRDSVASPKYSLFSQDLLKLNSYSQSFGQEDIQQLRKYKYMIFRLSEIEKHYQSTQQTLLSLEISNRIKETIHYYLDKVQKLQTEILRNELKTKTNNVLWYDRTQNFDICKTILESEILRELEQFSCVQKEISSSKIFQKSEQNRKIEYQRYLGFHKPINTLVIYNHDHKSGVNMQNLFTDYCNNLDKNLMQPGYSYCYKRSRKNFFQDDLVQNIEKTIQNNDNIHIVGINDGTADAQYMLGFIANILHNHYQLGQNYLGKIFIELYNPVGIAEKLAIQIEGSIKSLKLKNSIVVNIINEATNKSLAVGKCIGIDFARDQISKESLLFIKNRFLNSLNSHIGYQLPHDYETYQEDCYYFKLMPNTWQEFKQKMWGVQSVPTVHCMKRLAGLKGKYNENIFKELKNDLLYDQDLYQSLLKLDTSSHYTFSDIKDFLIYSPFFLNKVKILQSLIKANNIDEYNVF